MHNGAYVQSQHWPILVIRLLLALLAAPAAAAAAPRRQPANPDDEGILRTKLPTVTVTATKEPEDAQKVPVSVTAVSRQTLADSGARIVSDAAIFAPNTFFSEFTARKLSNARFRGISSSPANPGITTYIDGVPQLNTNSSSLELLDVGQMEFVRGPQSALFGRNTLGGLVSIATARPSTSRWTGSFSAPFGNISSWGCARNASGPVTDKVSAGFALAHMERDGYTVNDLTGNTIDDRSAFSAKGQVLWTPAQNWEARVIVSGERARDGDYALNDLATLRQTPFHSAVNFEGFTDRDIFSTAIQTRRTGGPLVFSTTTGFVKWKTQDVTDLDYTPLPLITRDNTEEDFQFTQEVRVASADNAALQLSDALALRWQAGVFLFTQGYDQDAVNNFAPGLISQQLPIPDQPALAAVRSRRLRPRLLRAGRVHAEPEPRFHGRRARRLREQERDTQHVLRSGDRAADTSSTRKRTSPKCRRSSRWPIAFSPSTRSTASVSRGFKAGGFNAASLPGSEAYGEEHTWNLEGGVKTTWAEGRVSANAAVFYIDWDDLQLNVPNPNVPAQFYIANVGSAKSNGVELELNARAAPGVDLFGGIGYTHARFGDNSRSSGVDVSGNKLPSTPDYTTMLGGQYSRVLSSSMTMYGRGEVVFYGAFKYDDQNREGQDAYSLANFRGGVRGKFFFADLWIRNAFDTRYIPIAFSYASFAPSGFVGEMGAPRTFGLSAGVTF